MAASMDQDASTEVSAQERDPRFQEKSGVVPDALAPQEVSEKASDESSRSNHEVGSEPEADEYPHGLKLGLITLALCLSVFCMALDNTILATAIPRITDDFQALDEIGWYASAYLLTNCAMQLTFGKLYTFYSIKWVYMLALLLFEVGSLVCALAPNSTALIIGRAIAGIGGAGIYSGAIIIISKTVPLHQRSAYTSAIGGMYGIASVVGPLLGGAFTDRLTWRWCFYINLPFGGVTAAFLIFFWEAPKIVQTRAASWREQINQFDLLGTLCFVPSVICMLLALQWGGSTYPWSNGRIIALFALSGVLMVIFVTIQSSKQENATVPPRIVKNRNVWGAGLINASLGASFFGIVYFLPVWFQAIKGVSAVESGIMNLPLILAQVVFTVVSGGGITSVGYYGPFLLFTTVAGSIGAGLLTTFQVDTGSPAWIGYQVLYGAGLGSGMQVGFVIVQACLPAPDIPVATALMISAQMLGGAVFVAVAQNIFSNLLTQNLMLAAPGVSPSIVASTGATDLKNVIDKAFLPDVLVAYNHALTQTWYVSVGTVAISIFGVIAIDWRVSVKHKPAATTAA